MNASAQSAARYLGYFCVATILAQLVIGVWWWWAGHLTCPKALGALMVLYEIPPQREGGGSSTAALSYEDLQQLRELDLLDLEFKQRALRHHREHIVAEHSRLKGARDGTETHPRATPAAAERLPRLEPAEPAPPMMQARFPASRPPAREEAVPDQRDRSPARSIRELLEQPQEDGKAEDPVPPVGDPKPVHPLLLED